MNKFEINAAIWAMLSRENIKDNGKIVIGYGNTLQVKSGFNLSITNTTESGNNSFTGETNSGQVQVPDEGMAESVTHEFGIRKNRIGHFKMWREFKNQIRFHHFWKSDPETQGAAESPDEYVIQYDPDLELSFFGQREEKPIFSLGPITFKRSIFVPIYGTGMIKDGWYLVIAF